MSARGARRRGRPPKTSYAPPRFLNARSGFIEKPKWLQNRDGTDGKDVYSSSGAISRASSPNGSINSFTQYSANKHISVTPFKKRGRKAGVRGRGAMKTYLPRPSLSITRDSDYHYGSDFESTSDSEDSPVENDVDNVESDVNLSNEDSEAEASDANDSDFSTSNQSYPARKPETYKRQPTPVPFWLQDGEIPKLQLPSTSEDLMLSANEALTVCSIYEVLRRFRTQVRLSPFRLEDFTVALQSPEMSGLLAEIHIMLLKALLREEDVQQTTFGPLDQKDSINSMLYFVDTFTWPEVLRVYMQSDVIFASTLKLLDSCDYPFTSCATRIEVLKFLTDQFLGASSVREDLISEGNIRYDDHCRVCHKVGDLLCCETCPAVYHLQCLDPPLEQVPSEDWQCQVCTAQQCKGVTDCVSEVEKSGFLCRHDCLGFDRHGRKYWFVARRIFVEDSERSGEVWYYSTETQLEVLLELLDPLEYERELCRELQNLQSEIIRQMRITEALTNEAKGEKQSYLEQAKSSVLEEKDELLKKEEVKEEMEVESDAKQIKTEETETKEEEEVVEECGVEVDDDFMQQLAAETEQPEASQDGEEQSTHETRLRTGTLTPKTYTDGKRKAADNGGTTIKEEETENKEDNNVIFKLGMENNYKNYVNQFSTNSLALNKNQTAEDRDKKRYLSHKFSLTGTGEFKWSGAVIGNKTVLLQTLRSSLLQLQSQLPSAFMHPNWTLLRKPWITAVNACVSPKDLGRTLTVLAACIRSVAFSSVWQESLGHVRLQRQTALEREEKKKVEKKEKKEKELEEEMNKVRSVHYSLGLKHQIWKHKGEEYRLHGQWGWRWLAAARVIKRVDARKVGLRAGPFKIRVLEKDGDLEKPVDKEPASVTEIPEVDQGNPALTLVDVSKGLSSPDRFLYPRMAKKGRLDSLLQLRLNMRTREEKQRQLNQGTTATSESLTKLEEDLRKLGRTYRCYSPSCKTFNCFSPTCRLISELQTQKREAEKKLEESRLSEKTSAPVALKKVVPEDERAKKKRVPVKYPMMSTFVTKSKKRSIFVLPEHELRHVARRGAQAYVSGIGHAAKSNSIAWPYPSMRPLFKTCWFYRTSKLHSLSSAAQQLRILWSCLRWEDMAAKPPTADGKNQLTTDTEIITTELLKHRFIGRFLERAQYYRRRVVIPLDVPKTIREVTPSRSGLRKRKMVETPQLSEPQVSEDWIEEDKLELWEIRLFHEKLERNVTPIVTRLKSGATTTPASKNNLEEIKEKVEQQLKLQRAAHQQKKGESTTPAATVNGRLATPGTAKSTLATLLVSDASTPKGTKGSVTVLSKDGTPKPAEPSAATPNRIQISKGPDGKLIVRGLQPGQQLVRLPNGSFTIVSSTAIQQQVKIVPAESGEAKTATVAVTPQPEAKANAEGTPSVGTKLQMATINGQQVLLQMPATAVPVKMAAAANPGSTAATPATKPTALMVQTAQGPRIIVQGLQNSNLTPQQILAIQQQLKAQLLKNQAKTATVAAAPATADSTTVAAANDTTAAPAPVSPSTNSQEKFVVTPDFIQQTIRKALKQENLHPEIEQKLLQLQRFQEKQKKQDDEEESVPVVPTRRRLLSGQEQTIVETPKSETVRRVMKITEPVPLGSSSAAKQANEERDQKAKERSLKAQQRAKERKFQQQQSRLQGLMARHAESLKKDMLRKRALLEKDLRLAIQRDLNAELGARRAYQSPPRTVTHQQVKESPPPPPPPVKAVQSGQKRKQQAETTATPQPSKRQRNSTSKSSMSSGTGSKKKLYCVCRTPYDNSKFYVGCDLCSNWFHGSCVGITEAMSQTMTEFVCDDCQKSRSNQELFCLCRQPYDESQFYICCDKCQDWFHGRCVGVLQAEGDKIDEYVCPRCDPNTPFNYANTRTLNSNDFEQLRKLLRQLQLHKSSWPFREPVNPREVPDYYKIIKEPMDLHMVENKLNERRYQRLMDFISDITKIFDNCRYYNSKESNIAKCAQGLETFFVPKLRVLRQSMERH